LISSFAHDESTRLFLIAQDISKADLSSTPPPHSPHPFQFRRFFIRQRPFSFNRVSPARITSRHLVRRWISLSTSPFISFHFDFCTFPQRLSFDNAVHNATHENVWS
jgi:hypothetical protein